MAIGAHYSCSELSLQDHAYPQTLKERMGQQAPRQLHVVGDLSALPHPRLAFLCSIRCPGDVILMAYDTARVLRDAGISVIGGFQSPMEQECFDLLIRGSQPIIWHSPDLLRE